MAWPVESRNEEELEMCFEIFRFVSFLTFPLNVSVSGLQLAGNGFYFTGRGATVRCFSCNIYHSEWQTDGVLFQVGNFMHAADCAFMLGTERCNVPIQRQPDDNQHVTSTHLPVGPMEHGSRYVDQEIAGEILFYASGVVFYDVTVDLAPYRRRHPSHPFYASQDVRLATFTNSQSHLQARAQTLTEAGFFYLGYQDRLRCFQCGCEVTVGEWDFDQWNAHAQRCPRCPFVLRHSH